MPIPMIYSTVCPRLLVHRRFRNLATMKRFSKLYEQAAARKGGPQALDNLIPTPSSAQALARIPDDRWLSGMAKAIFRAGFNWSVIDRKWPDIEDFSRRNPGRV